MSIEAAAEGEDEVVPVIVVVVGRVLVDHEAKGVGVVRRGPVVAVRLEVVLEVKYRNPVESLHPAKETKMNIQMMMKRRRRRSSRHLVAFLVLPLLTCRRLQ